MPLVDGQYTNPGFVNDSAPALNASEVNALATAVEGAVEYDRAQTLTDSQAAQARGNIGAISRAVYEVQALAANWVGSNAPYMNTITVTGLGATDDIVVGLSANTNATQYADFSNGAIICTGQAADSITLTAYGTKPTNDINISVIAIF